MFVCCILLSVSMTCMTLFKLLMQKEQQWAGFSASQGLSQEETRGTHPAQSPGDTAHRRGPAAPPKAGAALAASASCSFMSSACCLFCVPDV